MSGRWSPSQGDPFQSVLSPSHLGDLREPLGVTFSRPALSCQAAASSHVLRVLIGRIVLPRSLGTHLGSAQVPPGQLPASVADKFAVAE